MLADLKISPNLLMLTTISLTVYGLLLPCMCPHRDSLLVKIRVGIAIYIIGSRGSLELYDLVLRLNVFLLRIEADHRIHTSFGWGVIATAQSGTNSWSGMMACRFFLGISEAGFGPGIPYLLSFFYLRHEVKDFLKPLSPCSYPDLGRKRRLEPKSRSVIVSLCTLDLIWVLTGELAGRPSNCHLFVCGSLSNNLFWSISIWVKWPTSTIRSYVLIFIEGSLQVILILHNGVYFSL